MKKIAISGSHGFIGRALSKALIAKGFEIYPLVRKATEAQDILYDVDKNVIESDKLESLDVVINLAGRNIMDRPWTESFKAELKKSRVQTTKLIARALSKIKKGPKVLLSASAVGFYGDTGDKEIYENAFKGDGFLADLCYDWEQATNDARESGIRVVNMRFALVMGPGGGVYETMKPWFKRGLGLSFGSGTQYMPMVALDDLISAIIFLIYEQNIEGPVNIVAPQIPTNAYFSHALAESFHKSSKFHIPSWILDLLGEQGRMLTCSCRPYPRVLIKNGFHFKHENTHEIIRYLQDQKVS